MKIKYWYLCIIIGMGITTGLSLLFIHSTKKTGPKHHIKIPTHLKKTEQQESFASIIIKDFNLKELEKEKNLEFTVNAQKCDFNHTSEMVECSQVTCTLIDHNQLRACLKTGKALVNRTKKTIFLVGSVLGNMKDLTMQGTDINYDFSGQILTTTKPIIFSHPDFNLKANHCSVDLKNNKIQMSDGVVSDFTLHDKQLQP